MKEKKIALLIDVDNVKIGAEAFNELYDKLLDMGDVVYCKFYGYNDRKHLYLSEVIAKYGYETAPFMRFKKRYSQLDNRIIVDAVRLVYTKPEIDTYCIVAGDGDLIPLLVELKSSGKTVVATIMLLAGIENGYQGEHWSYLWDNDILKKMQFSYIVGNHEYVSKELGPKWDDRFYVSMYNNPKNGPEHYQNSAYYFRYNDALFVVWNPFNYSHFSEQAAWLDEVLSTQKAKYVFVLSHYPFGGGVDSARMNETVLPIVTKHGVDLVMSGHNHSYAYYDNYTKAPAEESFDHLLIANCDRRDYNHAVYSLINVTSTTVTVSNYSYDNKLVAEYKIYARRPNTEDISTSVVL